MKIDRRTFLKVIGVGIAGAPLLAREVKIESVQAVEPVDEVQAGELIVEWRNYLLFASRSSNRIQWCIKGQPISKDDWLVLPTYDVCSRFFLCSGYVEERILIPLSEPVIRWCGDHGDVFRIGCSDRFQTFVAELLYSNLPQGLNGQFLYVGENGPVWSDHSSLTKFFSSEQLSKTIIRNCSL